MATGVSALVSVLAGVGVLVDQTADTPVPLVPAASSSSVSVTSEAPAPAVPRCVMFCEDAGLGRPDIGKIPAPSPALEGCHLFCDLERGREGGGF
ncbi:hypothetical protein IU486_30745 [Streptomyces gardneri]|nr:hypothetical protein [Streptomyces gardneri]